MIEYDFNSLKDIPEWNKARSIFMTKMKPLNQLSKLFSKKYDFRDDDIKNAFLYEIMTFTYSKSKLKKFLYPNYIGSSLVYVIIMFILIACFPFFLFYDLFHKKKVVSLLYEEMWDKQSWYKRFYKYIDEKLNPNIRRALLLTSSSIFKQDTNSSKISRWSGKILDIRNRNKIFNSKVIFKVIVQDSKSIYFLYKLSKKYKVDFSYLYLRLLKRFILYSSQVANIDSKVLVAAGDYYWNPMKYLSYKRSIKNIILIQHNYKDNYLYGRLFPYCDYYFGHSKKALSRLEGVRFSKKYDVGSLQLIPFLKKESTDDTVDILFINQTVNDDLTSASPLLDHNKLIKQYKKLISNFSFLLQNNGHLNAVYMCKPGYLDTAPAKDVKKNFKNFKNINFVEAYGPQTFELVKKSKLIINMYSSVGFEAYGLDKKVLWINYENCCDIFKHEIENEDLHVLIKNKSYDRFEKKVKLLLSNNDQIKQHYKQLKQKYMNIKENPAKIIALEIEKILENSQSETIQKFTSIE